MCNCVFVYVRTYVNVYAPKDGKNYLHEMTLFIDLRN